MTAIDAHTFFAYRDDAPSTDRRLDATRDAHYNVLKAEGHER